jgi:hypothetical protein
MLPEARDEARRMLAYRRDPKPAGRRVAVDGARRPDSRFETRFHKRGRSAMSWPGSKASN